MAFSFLSHRNLPGLLKTPSLHIHTLGPQIHPLDFIFVHEVYSLKSIILIRSENTPLKYVYTVTPDFSQRLSLVSAHCAMGIVDNTVQKIVETAVEWTVTKMFTGCGLSLFHSSYMKCK